VSAKVKALHMIRVDYKLTDILVEGVIVKAIKIFQDQSHVEALREELLLID
jgi:hypothetical protein